MRFLVSVMFLCGAVSAQIYPPGSYTVIDACGGRPAWINSTSVVEDSSSTAGAGGTCTQSPKPNASSIPLFDLKSVTKSGSTWGTPVNLTSTLRAALSPAIDPNCSIGNPDSDGTHLVAIVQDTAGGGSHPCALNSGATANPGSGQYYDVMFCNAVSSLSASTCAVLGFSNKTTTKQGAFLDPHIDVNHVYISERNSPQYTTTSYNYWTVDDFQVNWNGSGTAPTLAPSQPTAYMPGTWSAQSQSLGCEQFYKATSYQHLSNGNTRIYTQENQISNYPVLMSATKCSQIGRDTYSTGVGYFDLTMVTGGTLTQIYPAPGYSPPGSTNCLTSSAVSACYAEFPIVVPTGAHLFMVFIGLTSTPAALINECAALQPSGCNPNFPSETLMMDLGGNTQMPASGAVVRQSDFQIAGTPLDVFLMGGLNAGNFGNCSHLSLNLPSLQLVCDIRTNIANQLDQTVVFPQKYAGSFMFPSSLVEGRTKILGNAKLH